MKMATFIWGRVTFTAATAALAILVSIGDPSKPWNWEDAFGDDRPWKWIFGLAGFLVLHSWISWRRELARVRRSTNDREVIQSTVLHLISDLSSLAGQRYDLWMIDLYLKRRIWSVSLRWPFVRRNVLERDLSISLADVTKLAGTIELSDEFFGACIRNGESKSWWDPNIAQTALDAENSMDQLTENRNVDLRRRCGVVKTWPIVDQQGRTCSGILAVHARRDSEVATKVLGALVGENADRFLSRTSEDIYNQLIKKE